MSIIIRSLEERKAINTIGKTVAAVSIDPKSEADFHEGHQMIVEHAKTIADVVFVNSFEVRPFLDILWGNETAFYRDSTFSYIPSEQDMIDWCNLNRVDYVWMPPKDFYLELFEGYDLDELKQWAEDISIKEGYITLNEMVNRHIKYLIICQKPIIDNNYFHYNYRVTSWKDGVIRFFEKDFYNKYIGTDIIILDPITNEDKLPLSSGFNLWSSDEMLKLKQIQKFLINADINAIVLNIKKFQDNTKIHISGLSDENIKVELKKFDISDISFLPLNKRLMEIHIRINTEKTFQWNLLK